MCLYKPRYHFKIILASFQVTLWASTWHEITKFSKYYMLFINLLIICFFFKKRNRKKNETRVCYSSESCVFSRTPKFMTNGTKTLSGSKPGARIQAMLDLIIY